MENGITVTGSGAASDIPDVFVVEIGAAGSADAPPAALERAATALMAMRQAALAEGVPASALTTRDMVIHPDYDHEGKPKGFLAELALTVRVAADGRPGELVGACVEAGGDGARLQRTFFEHSDPSALLVRAREAAFTDAHARATQFAALAGRQLGPVRSIVEGQPAWTPMARTDMKMMSAVPVDAGTLEATAAVTVTWEFA